MFPETLSSINAAVLEELRNKHENSLTSYWFSRRISSIDDRDSTSRNKCIVCCHRKLILTFLSPLSINEFTFFRYIMAYFLTLTLHIFLFSSFSLLNFVQSETIEENNDQVLSQIIVVCSRSYCALNNLLL